MAKKDRENTIENAGRPAFSRFRVLWSYSVLFIAVSFIIFLPFIMGRRTLLWAADGYHQHIKALIFYSDWLRAGCPADYSFSLGYGGNIISTMQHYCLGEPLAALSYFVPREKMLLFYCALSVFRHYLAGLAFAAAYSYCRKGRASSGGCVAGALIYAYCGYAIHFGVQHPMFVTPMIYLPLMILGIEKYLRDRKPAIFMISVFLSAVTDFYFLYILGLAVIAYYLIFGMMRVGKTGFGGFVKNGFALLGLALAGMCMAGVVLAPVLYAFLMDPRTEYSEAFGYFYSLKELVRIPEAVLSSEYTSRSMILGVGALTVPAGFMMVTGIRKHPGVFAAFLLSLAALAMPVFAYVSNGFSTVENRWIFIEALILAVMDAVAVDELRTAGKLRGSMVFLGSVFYVGAIGYLYYRMGELDLSHINTILIIQAAIVLVIAIVILIASFSPEDRRNGGIRLVALLGIASVAVSGFWHFCDRGGNWASVFMAPDEIRLWDGPASVVADLGSGGFFRYEYPDEDRSDENSSDLYGLSTTGYYYSLSNKSVSDYMTEMAVTDPLDALNCYHGLDGRWPLLQMAAVKYYVSEFENAPFGYERLKKNNGLYISENTAPTGLVHSYSRILDQASYEKLSAVDRQYAMMKGAFIGDVKGKLSGVMEIVTARRISKEMKFSVDASSDGAAASVSSFRISDKNAVIELRPAQMTEGEYSLLFTGLSFDGSGYPDPFAGRTAGRIPVRVSFMRSGKTVAESIIQIFTDETPANRYQDDYLISSQWAEKGIDNIVLEFTYPGEYRFSDLKLFHIDKSAASACYSEYQDDDPVNVELHDSKMKYVTDEITVTGKWSKDSIVCFSIPAAKGWKCTVDGKQAELLNVNGMYMGAEVSEGSHEILLKYQCPMKMPGFIATVSGTAIFALIVIVSWFARRKERKRGKDKTYPDHSSADKNSIEKNDAEDYSFESVMSSFEPLHEASLEWDSGEKKTGAEPGGIKLVWDESAPSAVPVSDISAGSASSFDTQSPGKAAEAERQSGQGNGIELVFDSEADSVKK